MSTTFQNNFDDNNGEFCTEFEKSQVVVAIQRHVAQRIRRRVTLADLLMVDVHGNKPKPKPKPEAETVPVPDFQKKLPEVETDRGSCFSEKPKAAPEPPTRNLRRLLVLEIHHLATIEFPKIVLMASDPKLFVFDEVAKHNHQGDCWLIISGKVYDVTPFLEDHPGGDEVLLLATEKDATEDFETVGHSLSATEEMEKYYIGNIDMSTVPKVDYRPPASKSASTETKAAAETTSSNQSSGSLIKVLQLLIPLLIIVVAFYLQYYGKKQ
ncbi:cytochrome b5-like [Cucumis melo var. makuwa]|uniref:Cytochrome b5-like n=2 Tax=Cucumis melo TaxID=3656 RepID=A0A5A7U0D0_CUCMM|nr:cytochrome b5-like [Cucumis melo var. makuwa]